MRSLALMSLSLVLCGQSEAMPFPDFQDYGTANIGMCSTGNIGATIGSLSYQGFKGEVGIDFNTRNLSKPGLSAKVGFDEGFNNPNVPAINVGVSQAEIKTKGDPIEHQNIFHVMVAKSIKNSMDARAYVGYFIGNKQMGESKDGYFIGYTQYLLPLIVEGKKIYNRVNLDAVYVSGKSDLGSLKLATKYYFSPKVNIQCGPIWDLNKKTSDTSKWALDKITWFVSFSIDV